ncbi:uncharacterized protein LOC135392766 isoform X2 [Ornithodoros turicata]|uniref:uncharacterized protein LOC135392766 isoform X2 n=1 Tax=Ornithodoros turicata TaxID=34597 RepID=UPI0031394935
MASHSRKENYGYSLRPPQSQPSATSLRREDRNPPAAPYKYGAPPHPYRQVGANQGAIQTQPSATSLRREDVNPAAAPYKYGADTYRQAGTNEAMIRALHSAGRTPDLTRQPVTRYKGPVRAASRLPTSQPGRSYPAYSRPMASTGNPPESQAGGRTPDVIARLPGSARPQMEVKWCKECHGYVPAVGHHHPLGDKPYLGRHLEKHLERFSQMGIPRKHHHIKKHRRGRDVEHLSEQTSTELTPSQSTSNAPSNIDPRIKTPFYKKLKLPSGRKVDVVHRNLYLKKWYKKRIKCEYCPFIVIFVTMLLMILVLYLYLYHQEVLFKIVNYLVFPQLSPTTTRWRVFGPSMKRTPLDSTSKQIWNLFLRQT